jgi:hypothetical protein
MAVDILTDIGEEYVIKNGLDGATVNVGVYNDSTDSISDTDNVSAITTEPSNGNYSTASVSLSAVDVSGDWGADNDSQISFDFSDQSTSETVDAFYITVNFNSTEAGTTSDHLIGTAAMTQNRDIGSIDTLNVSAGDLEATIN